MERPSEQTRPETPASLVASAATATRPRPEFVPRPRPVAEVAVDVVAWQDRLMAGLDPGPVPISESGWPLSYEAARVYFGHRNLPRRACHVHRR